MGVGVENPAAAMPAVTFGSNKKALKFKKINSLSKLQVLLSMAPSARGTPLASFPARIRRPDLDVGAIHLVMIQRLDDHFHAFHGSKFRKQASQGLFRCSKRQIANINIHVKNLSSIVALRNFRGQKQTVPAGHRDIIIFLQEWR